MGKNVYLNYKDLEIGKLVFEEGLYKFRINQNAKESAEQYGFPFALYFQDNEWLESKQLFDFLEDFIPQKSRFDLNKRCGIKETDNDFQKLRKMVSLKLSKNGLWLSDERNMNNGKKIENGVRIV